MLGFNRYSLNKLLTKLPFPLQEVIKIEDEYRYSTGAMPGRHSTVFYTDSDCFALRTGPWRHLNCQDVLEIARLADLNQLAFFFQDDRQGPGAGCDRLVCCKSTAAELVIHKPELMRRERRMNSIVQCLMLLFSLMMIVGAVVLVIIHLPERLRRQDWLLLTAAAAALSIGFYYFYCMVQDFINKYYFHQAFNRSLFEEIPYPVIRLNDQGLFYNRDMIVWAEVEGLEHSDYKTVLYAAGAKRYVIPKYEDISKYSTELVAQTIIKKAGLKPYSKEHWRKNAAPLERMSLQKGQQ